MTGNLSGAEQSLLDRFADGLARILYEERPEALSRPVTVAELYQDIAPYRRMREVAGIEIHADYEHALIRLLAGEGGFARLDPESAADELGIEAESSDPDLSLYRKFAACDVRLSLARSSRDRPPERSEPVEIRPPQPLRKESPRVAEPTRALEPDPAAPASARAEPDPRATLAETMRALEPVARARTAERGATAASGSGVAAISGASGAVAKPTPRCAHCGQGLPRDRSVRFCPHCGVDQTARQCGACGEEMEAGWHFCVACGAAADS